MTVITVNALETMLGGAAAAAKAYIRFEYRMAGEQPVARVDGADVTLARTIEVNILAGVPEVPIDAPATIEDLTYAHVTVGSKMPGTPVVRMDVVIPASETPVDIGALVVVDPASFEIVQPGSTVAQMLALKANADAVYSKTVADERFATAEQGGKADSAYQIPDGGVPASDLEEAVRTSLTKADDALPAAQKGANDGVAELVGGKVPAAQTDMAAIASSPELGAAIAESDAVLTARGGGPEGRLSLPISGDIPTLAVTGPGGPNPIPSPTNYTYDNTAAIRRVGCVGVIVNQFSTNYIQNQANGNTGSGAQPWAVEFITEEADMVIPFRAATVAQVRFWVWVDGIPTTPAPVRFASGISAGSKSWFRVTFPYSRRRVVRVYMIYADYGGLSVGSSGSATASTAWEPFKLAVVGDSWIDTADVIASVAGAIGLSLRAETFMCGWAGSGYVAGTPFGSASRTAKLYAAEPDIIIVAGSINDNPSAASVQAAASAYYAGIASNLPDAKVIVVGPQPVPADYATSSTLLANRDAVQAAADAASNVLGFVDPISLGWLTGTGTVGSPKGDGNRDYYVGSSSHVDTLHLGNLGRTYWGQRIMQEVLRICEANNITFVS